MAVAPIQFHGITEGQIDFLLATTLAREPAFAEPWLRLCGIPPGMHVSRIELHSRARNELLESRGETDVIVHAKQGSGTTAVFVENKIDALLQERQLERQLSRAGETRGLSVLFAPQGYGGGASLPAGTRFVSYEQTRTLAQQSGEKAVILVQALDQAILAASLVKPALATAMAFDRLYRDQINSAFADWRLGKPGTKKYGGGFVWLNFQAVSKKVGFKHKLDRPSVELELRGARRARDDFVARFGATLPPGTRVFPANGSSSTLMVSRDLPVKIRSRDPFDPQHLASCIPEIRALYSWYIQVERDLLPWLASIGPRRPHGKR